MDTAFRKIDIDQYDEDRLVPEDLYDPDPRGLDGVLADARNRSAEVRSLLSRPLPFTESDHGCSVVNTQFHSLNGYPSNSEESRWSSAGSTYGISVQGKSDCRVCYIPTAGAATTTFLVAFSHELLTFCPTPIAHCLNGISFHSPYSGNGQSKRSQRISSAQLARKGSFLSIPIAQLSNIAKFNPSAHQSDLRHITLLKFS
ncbi:hypothetical protein QFC19_000720 [Naganishia cerealis]|uniref:Uncharacterized protein n=1 Tax=Naganishia cerealis TaxID=610337 RepID=A0ACC2WNC3_9TREE|nr:hypothetical protein QFC19_000720 [Naganishia cerealis]